LAEKKLITILCIYYLDVPDDAQDLALTCLSIWQNTQDGDACNKCMTNSVPASRADRYCRARTHVVPQHGSTSQWKQTCARARIYDRRGVCADAGLRVFHANPKPWAWVLAVDSKSSPRMNSDERIVSYGHLSIKVGGVVFGHKDNGRNGLSLLARRVENWSVLSTRCNHSTFPRGTEGDILSLVVRPRIFPLPRRSHLWPPVVLHSTGAQCHRQSG